jgi:hypothetical protein
MGWGAAFRKLVHTDTAEDRAELAKERNDWHHGAKASYHRAQSSVAKKNVASDNKLGKKNT